METQDRIGVVGSEHLVGRLRQPLLKGRIAAGPIARPTRSPRSLIRPMTTLSNLVSSNTARRSLSSLRVSEPNPARIVEGGMCIELQRRSRRSSPPESTVVAEPKTVRRFWCCGIGGRPGHHPVPTALHFGMPRRVVQRRRQRPQRHPFKLRRCTGLTVALNQVEHRANLDTAVSQCPQCAFKDVEAGTLRMPANQQRAGPGTPAPRWRRRSRSFRPLRPRHEHRATDPATRLRPRTCRQVPCKRPGRTAPSFLWCPACTPASPCARAPAPGLATGTRSHAPAGPIASTAGSGGAMSRPSADWVSTTPRSTSRLSSIANSVKVLSRHTRTSPDSSPNVGFGKSFHRA